MAAVENEQMLAPGDGEAEIHGDILETVFSQVPLVDLVSASHVSRSWCDAVSSSLRHWNKPRPWLILHAQSTRLPYAVKTHAYDPRSDVWIDIPRPPRIEHASPIKCSHSSFLYTLSPSRFSFSSDPLNFNWHHAAAPLVWRRDPIVALVGSAVVIAGGGCDFEDDPLAVEIYDLRTRSWRTCDSMPSSLRDSAASPRLSIAAAAEKLIVTDKETGLTHWFDPGTELWSGSFNLNPGQPVSIYNIGYTDGGLILVGLCRIKNLERVKIWRIDGDDFAECEEVGEMPPDFTEKLRSESFGNCSINIRAAGNTVYVYNDAWDVGEVVACEVDVRGWGVKWWSVRNVVAREAMVTERMVFTCAEVGIAELERVMTAASRGFELHSVS